MTPIWIALAVVTVLALAFVLWRRRRRRQHRLISFVGLLREPFNLDPAVLAQVAAKVWHADFGDGSSEGADGFVVGIPASCTIVHGDRFFLINSLPMPYVEDLEGAAAGMSDLRIRSLFLEHRAWFSCDAMGVDASTPDDEVRQWYRRLAKLFGELLDENCLLIYLPDSQLAFPVNEDTELALRSGDPLKALRATASLPVVQVASDNAAVIRAREQALARWPEFVTAFEANAGDNFSVKAPVTHGENTEFIWLTVTSIEGERVYGELANHPADLGPLKLGSKVSVPAGDVQDWCFADRKGALVGGFSIEAVSKALRPPE